ncbi:pilus (MSHA type) biogenesis protein MshL [Acidithiobacillus ferriphilus]|uniref:pilus (MSHA type) biogenesis protein MshL n=1 Tax=Acidithiobacillus ferriphilus TaxID=1689834 RepID=UPI001C06CA47|nr:pilus (MSHA type) biogenesis protein MshL [Acidithiobacillus ferriphilus]MBU2831018.1 pilus (MSHA type) biogenesis protein MshL [Acidithiobacillus ferriphilus]
MRKQLAILMSCIWLAGCQTVPDNPASAMLPATKPAIKPPPPAVQQALLPPVDSLIPRRPSPLQKRFDLVVQNAPAREVFMGLGMSSGQNVILSPKVGGSLTLDLHHVTLDDALRAIRAAYGYQYEVQGRQIVIYPPAPETRIYRVNYLDIARSAKSQLTVAGTELNGNSGNNGGGGMVGQGQAFGQSKPSAEVKTDSSSDFWKTLKPLLGMVAGKEGKVIISPLSGVIVVRAMPDRQREIQAFLHHLTNGLERQVILEAKILEVQLSSGFQAGINWSTVMGNAQINQLAPINSNGSFNTNGYAPTQGTITSGGTTPNLGQLAPGLLPAMNAVQPFGGVFNAVISGGKGFNAILEALGTQGKVKVLSSPRVATLNNQTAVIKVGTDNIYVTNVQTNAGTSSGVIGSTVINQATPVLSPLFSGVALDVTPAISGDGMVTLYVHPSVTSVTTQAQAFTVGNQSYVLPLASSSVREVDTVVRAASGQVIVIGGLMKTDEHSSHSGIPLLQDIPYLGYLFKSTQQTAIKSELVVLIKPIVVDKRGVWQQQIHQARKELSEHDLDFNTAVLPARQMEAAH